MRCAATVATSSGSAVTATIFASATVLPRYNARNVVMGKPSSRHWGLSLYAVGERRMGTNQRKNFQKNYGRGAIAGKSTAILVLPCTFFPQCACRRSSQYLLGDEAARQFALV